MRKSPRANGCAFFYLTEGGNNELLEAVPRDLGSARCVRIFSRRAGTVAPLCDTIYALSWLRYIHDDHGADRNGLYDSLPRREQPGVPRPGPYSHLQSKGCRSSAW